MECLKFSMTEVGFLGVHSFKDGFTHKVFGLHHFLNTVDNGFCMNSWKHDHPVLIPKNVVPGLDRDFSDRDGNFVLFICKVFLNGWLSFPIVSSEKENPFQVSVIKSLI